VQHGLSLHGTLSTDVNLQNSQAVGFYQRMGFVETGRSEVDSQGRSCPLLHLMYQG
jgi:putative acetyltransferase